jgi:DNA-binding transcriptional LysR family regulator
MNFDIDCLRTFLLVADSMSFSRAGECVGRSQSTISQQISKLEAQVGKSILDQAQRSRHRVDS